MDLMAEATAVTEDKIYIFLLLIFNTTTLVFT